MDNPLPLSYPILAEWHYANLRLYLIHIGLFHPGQASQIYSPYFCAAYLVRNKDTCTLQLYASVISSY